MHISSEVSSILVSEAYFQVSVDGITAYSWVSLIPVNGAYSQINMDRVAA